MDDPKEAISIMRSLSARGIHLAMDDFGTGHSSLSCLHRFPIDVLKIDRSFICNMENHVEFIAVMHAIVTLAQHLQLQVVAEGIENAEQLSCLQAMECGYAQGYLFAPPLSTEDVSRLLTTGIDHTAAA